MRELDANGTAVYAEIAGDDDELRHSEEQRTLKPNQLDSTLNGNSTTH